MHPLYAHAFGLSDAAISYTIYRMRIQKKPFAKSFRILLLIVALVVTLAGGYLLWVSLTPVVKTALINPTNNATTKRLEKKDSSENRLYIPSIDINVPYGKTENSLYYGAWWRKPENGNPKDGGNFVLAAHRFELRLDHGVAVNSPFYAIDKVKIGNLIIVDYNGTRYTYSAKERRRVLPNEVSIEARTNTPQLTLYTCTLDGSADGREVVVAELIKT